MHSSRDAFILGLRAQILKGQLFSENLQLPAAHSPYQSYMFLQISQEHESLCPPQPAQQPENCGMGNNKILLEFTQECATRLSPEARDSGRMKPSCTNIVH